VPHEGQLLPGWGALVAAILLLAPIYFYKFQAQGFTLDSITSLLPGALAVGGCILLARASALGAVDATLSVRGLRLVYPSGRQRVYDFSS
jgi:hypothetical protein